MLITGITLCIITTFPYLLAYLGCPEGKVYSGIHTINSADLYQYLTLARQATDGRLLMEVPFTIEPGHQGLMLRPVFILVGLISSLPGIPLLFSFHLVRIMFILMLVAALYTGSKVFISNRATRRIFILIFLFSSGFGWLSTESASDSCDLVMPESVAFLGCLESPHFPASLLFFFLSITLGIRALRSGGIAAGFACGISLFFLALIHPFDIPVAGLLLAAVVTKYLFGRSGKGTKQTILSAISIVIPATAGILITYLPTLYDPVLSCWRNHNYLPSPPPLFFIKGLGNHILLLLPGFFASHYSGLQYRRLLLLWVLVTAALLYAPVTFQRRVIEGIQIPLSIFSASAISYALSWVKWSGMKALVVVFAIFFFVPGNIKVIANDVLEPANEKTLHPFYLPGEWVDGMKWLGRRCVPGDGVLASAIASNYLPAFAGCKVPWGHRYMSVLFPDTGTRLKMLLEGKLTATEDLDFMKKYGIRFVFLDSPGAATIFGKYHPWEKGYLQQVYFNDAVSIYMVVDNLKH